MRAATENPVPVVDTIELTIAQDSVRFADGSKPSGFRLVLALVRVELETQSAVAAG